MESTQVGHSLPTVLGNIVKMSTMIDKAVSSYTSVYYIVSTIIVSQEIIEYIKCTRKIIKLLKTCTGRRRGK